MDGKSVSFLHQTIVSGVFILLILKSPEDSLYQQFFQLYPLSYERKFFYSPKDEVQ